MASFADPSVSIHSNPVICWVGVLQKVLCHASESTSIMGVSWLIGQVISLAIPKQDKFVFSPFLFSVPAVVVTFFLNFMQNLHNLVIFLDRLANFGAILHNFKLSKKGRIFFFLFFFLHKTVGTVFTYCM